MAEINRIYSGTDIIRISRIKKLLAEDYTSSNSFVAKCFTEREAEYCFSKKSENAQAESFAARYAGKEAASKALGTGIFTQGIRLTDFEIINDDKGCPNLILHGKAERTAKEKGIESTSISLSHDGDYAIAYCCMISGADEEEQ